MIIIRNVYKIKPGMRDAFIAETNALNIQERLRKEPGNLLFELYCPIDDDTNVGLVDVWEDRATFEAHLTCQTNLDWAPAKEKYTTGSQWTLYEGDLNPEYTKEILEIQAKAAAERKTRTEG